MDFFGQMLGLQPLTLIPYASQNIWQKVSNLVEYELADS